MRCRLHQDRQGARRAEVTARPEHSGPAEPTDPDRHISGSRGFLFPPFHTSLFSHLIPPSSTTAAFPAFLCRCGIAFSTDPLLQALWTTFSFSPLSTTAAFPAFLCRCGMAFLTAPYYRPPGPHSPFTTFSQRQHFPRFSAVAAWPFHRSPATGLPRTRPAFER